MRRAFTLIEALLALTLTGLLAAGCVTLLMETARARAELETAPLLARHARGLGGFLENSVRRTLAALHLRLDGMNELPVSDETRPTGEGWLSLEQDTGLVLQWRTDREAKADATRLNRTVISPYVVGWNSLVYDPTRDLWGADAPERPEFSANLKRRLLIRLRRFGETAELAVSLDAPPAHAPSY
jgi:hypothetical protein